MTWKLDFPEAKDPLLPCNALPMEKEYHPFSPPGSFSERFLASFAGLTHKRR